MFNSILDDLRRTMKSGNMVSKIIIINIAFFVIINLVKVFDFNSGAGFYYLVHNGLSLPSDPMTLIKQPWSLISHMFLHVGFWHIIWNMLLFYWFGKIVGDFIGDNRVLPIYILSGLFGGLIYILSDLFLPGGSDGMAYAMGASAAVMAMLWTAASLSPDYIMHLILLGPVRLKYIAIALLLLDIISTAGMSNSGGHYAHIGGALWGISYVFALRKGTDMTDIFPFNLANREKKRRKTAKSKFKVIHNVQDQSKKAEAKKSPTKQEELDRILDKINSKGYDQLSDEEKEFLYQASKKE